MTVFVDTSAWIATVYFKDQYHSRATEAFKQLQQNKIQLLTTNFVFDETLTSLLQKVDYDTTIAFGDFVFNSQTINYHRLTSLQEQSAYEIFKRFNRDKNWSFTDCTSYIVMKTRSISQVFTFDQHFSQMGFTVIPS